MTCEAAPDIPIKPKSNDQGTLSSLLTRGMSCLENYCDDDIDEPNRAPNHSDCDTDEEKGDVFG